LQLLVQNVLNPDALKFDPSFVSRLVEDGLDRGFAPPSLPGVYSTVAQLQSRVLARVMNDSVAQRLLEAETKVADRNQIFQLSEVYSTVQNSVWQELASGQDISLQRRTLQRDHLRRLTSLVLRPVGLGPMDTRSLARLQAQDLANKLRQANARNSKLSAEARAHIAESLASLEDSLKAPLVRQGG
jgi:nitrogen-specific signal transduction histidine kinase